MAHDMAQQVSYLRAALEQEKKPLGFLIGAGAPMSIRVGSEPLVPGLEKLTALVREEIDSKYTPAIDILIGHLAAADQGNLEALLNYVRSLAALPGDEDIRGVSVKALAELDAQITKVIRKHVNQLLPEGDSAYFSLALWVSAVRRLTPTQIFTTNYDLLMEQALERQKVAYFDGFMGSHEPTFDLQSVEEDQLPSRWTLLWKLHGSINWSQDGQGNVVRRLTGSADETSALVYPSHLKYEQSRRLPYLAMMDRLKAFLRKPGAVLVTSGYSFRDQHINEVLDQALRANPTASVQGTLFGKLEAYEDAISLAKGLPNLVLLAEDRAVVGTITDLWGASTKEGETVPSPATCDLGDFAAMGRMLRELTGEIPTKDNDDV